MRTILGGSVVASSAATYNATDDAHEAAHETYMDTVLTWECAVLFVGFFLVTLVWEFSTALLGYITLRTSGRKAIWLQRLKGEILALGLITLILQAVTELLISICITGTPADYDIALCPTGMRPLFNTHMLHGTHWLIFGTAVLYIIITCSIFYMTLARMRIWRGWEKDARSGVRIEKKEAILMRRLGITAWSHGWFSFIGAFSSNVTEPVYVLLRLLFQKRMDDVARKEDKLPREFNFLHVVEQAMEVEFSDNSKVTVVLFLFMAIFLIIPRSAKGIYFLSGLAIITLLVVSAKLQSTVVHLAATTLSDFPEDADDIFLINADESNASFRGPKRSKIRPEPDMEVGFHRQESIVHSESYRSRVKLHLRDTSLNSSERLISKNCKPLFWFGRPGFLMVLFEIAFLEISLALTLLFYGLVMDKSYFVKQEGLPLIVICIIIDVLALIYAAIIVQPVAALVNTAGTNHPSHLLIEIKKMKLVSEEEWEEGLGGMLLKFCLPSEEMARTVDDERVAEQSKSFIMMLADQAGVITAVRHDTSGIQGTIVRLHKAFMMTWIQQVRDWKKDPSTKQSYEVISELTKLYGAFNAIDLDHSGAISKSELAALLKGMGTRATVEELEDMVDAIDVDDNGIELNEFILFLIFKFYDADNDAFISVEDIINTWQNLSISPESTDLTPNDLIEFCKSKRPNKKDVRFWINLADFVDLFQDVSLQDETLLDVACIIKGESTKDKSSPGGEDSLTSQFAKSWLQQSLDWKLNPRAQNHYTISCDLAKLHRGFDTIDADRSGSICSHEIVSLLKAMGETSNHRELRKMVKEIDVDGSEKVEFNEFLLFIVFKFFDENNSCTIAANDVKAGFDLLQIDVSNDDIEALMNFCFKVSKTRRNKSTHEGRKVTLPEFMKVFMASTTFKNSK